MTTAELRRVDLTAVAADLLRKLTGQYGPLMFHQSGGCCDGSSPMCYPDGEFQTGDADVLLAELPVPGLDRPVPFWMSACDSQVTPRRTIAPTAPRHPRW